MVTQALQFHGATRREDDSQTSLDLCLSDSQCSKQEEFVVESMQDGDIGSYGLETPVRAL